MAFTIASGIYSINTHILDFGLLFGTKAANDVIHIKDISNCSSSESVNIAVGEKFLKVFTDAGIGGRAFAFYTSDNLATHPIQEGYAILNPANYPKNLFRLTFNDRNPGNNTEKFIGSSDIRNDYTGGFYKITEYTNFHLADKYIGFRKQVVGTGHELKVRRNTTEANAIIKNVVTVNNTADCESVRGHKNIASYSCVTGNVVCP